MNTLLTTVNIRRIVYLLGGIAFIALALKDKVWWIGIAGIYFVAMAVLKKGCASGSCDVNPKQEE